MTATARFMNRLDAFQDANTDMAIAVLDHVTDALPTIGRVTGRIAGLTVIAVCGIIAAGQTITPTAVRLFNRLATMLTAITSRYDADSQCADLIECDLLRRRCTVNFLKGGAYTYAGIRRRDMISYLLRRNPMTGQFVNKTVLWHGTCIG
jgi:hypothetical protein